jgi:WD40 repeat protein
MAGMQTLSELDDAIVDLCWDDGGTFYAGLANGSIFNVSVEGNVLKHWKAHEGAVQRICINPDGRSFASAGEDGRVLYWDKFKQETLELANEPVWVEQLEWSSTGEVLAASAGKTIFLWRGTESIGAWYDARRHVQAMSWSPSSPKLATATNKGLYLWQMGDEEPVELLAFPGAAVSVSWKPDGDALAVGTQDGFLQIWRQGKKEGARQLTMSGYPGKVNCLDWHPSANKIVTAGGKDVVIWDMTEPGKKKALPVSVHQSTVTAVQYAPDGETIVSADRTGQVFLLDQSGKPLALFESGAEVTTLAWASDGLSFLVGNIEGKIDIYHIQTLS